MITLITCILISSSQCVVTERRSFATADQCRAAWRRQTTVVLAALGHGRAEVYCERTLTERVR